LYDTPGNEITAMYYTFEDVQRHHMSNTNDPLKTAMSAFGTRVANTAIPDLKVGESVTLKLSVPELSSIGHDFNSQLLRKASLELKPGRDTYLVLTRNGGDVKLTLTKRF
jgi:hypothetical protein